jgi:thioredoxin reductase
MKKVFTLLLIIPFSLSLLATEEEREPPTKEKNLSEQTSPQKEQEEEKPSQEKGLSVQTAPFPKQPVPIAVIGGGISGLTCAIECAKMGYEVVVCDDPEKKWREIESPISRWPGSSSNSWNELLKTIGDQAENKLSFYQTKVTQVTKSQNVFQIVSNKGTFSSYTLVIATGQEPEQMPFFAKNRFLPRPWMTKALQPSDTAIIIASDEKYLLSLVQLSFRVKKVYCFTKNFRPVAHSPLEKLAQKLPNIEHILYDRIDKITNNAEAVLLHYLRQGSKKQIEASWIILDTAWMPNSKVFSKIASIDSRGAVITEAESGQTSTSGLFACGEVSHKDHISAIRAAAEGEEAAQSVCRYLLEHWILPGSKKS